MAHQFLSPFQRSTEMVYTKKILSASLALALAGTASARDLAPVDALSLADKTSSSQTLNLSKKFSGHKGHMEERLGIPTFLTLSPQAVQKSAMGMVALPETTARQQLKARADTYKISSSEVDALPVKQVQQLSSGASIVQFAHEVNGIEVFRERANVLVGTRGELIAIGGYVSGAGNVTATNSQTLFTLQPQEAISAALVDFDFPAALVAPALQTQGNKGGYDYFVLNNMPSQTGAALTKPARIKPVFYRLPSGLVPAYYLEVQVADSPTVPSDYYGYVVSAKDGSVLFRHNQRADAQKYTYRVWAETKAPFLPYPGPQGRNGTPHPTAVPDGYQAPLIAPHAITLQNGPISTNDPWLPDDAKETTGNNVDAYADVVEPDGFSEGDNRPDTTAANQFDRTYNTALAPGSSTDQTKAAVTQMFYSINWLHDWYYDAGFDEASGNAQVSNYGRGGVEGDALLAEGQDNSGRNNANMYTPADGESPRMQMYVFDGNSASHVVFSGHLEAENPTGVATFGANSFDITKNVVLVDDGSFDTAPDSPPSTAGSLSDACQTPFANTTAINGNIALVDRGGSCGFSIKAKNAQLNGAVGIILIDTQSGSGSPAMMRGIDDAVIIPVLSINQTNGNRLKAALVRGTVSARMERVTGIARDGTIDNAIIAHEWGHYISNRLVYNASGLNTNMAGGLGEGWADFHSLLMMVKSEDALIPANFNFSGTYAAGSYVDGGPSIPVNPNQGFYYGLRRYPYSTNFAKNPLTFKHIQAGVPLPISPAVNLNGVSNSEVHNTGEVWANTLWGCYASLLNSNGRLTFSQAQDRMKRYLVASYKMTPPNPTFLEARDALLSVMYAQDRTDFVGCGQAFAQRGAGSNAVAPDRFDDNNFGVIESYSFGASLEFSRATVIDTPRSCDADGILDNKEQGTLAVTVRNAGFEKLFASTLTVSSPNAGVSFSQATVNIPPSNPFESKTVEVPIQVAGLSGIQTVTVYFLASDPSFVAPVVSSSRFRVNVDELTQTAKTDDFENREVAWATALEGITDPGFAWRRIERTVEAHAIHVPDNAAPAVSYLVSPPLQVSANGDFGFMFDQRYQFESGMTADKDFDGGVIEISTDGGTTWQDIASVAGVIMTPKYNGTLAVLPEGATYPPNPLAGRAAYVRNSTGWPAYDPVIVNLGKALQGQTVQIRFGVATDVNTGLYGWEIDNISFTGIDNSPFGSIVADRGECTPSTNNAAIPQTSPVFTTFGPGFQAQ